MGIIDKMNDRRNREGGSRKGACTVAAWGGEGGRVHIHSRGEPQMRSKMLLSLFATLFATFALLGCVDQGAEPDPVDDSTLETAPLSDPAPSLQEVPSSLELKPEAFACFRNPAWTCTTKAQCDTMCGGVGYGVCDFRTLCCACLL
jgi:hypothetical protein